MTHMDGDVVKLEVEGEGHPESLLWQARCFPERSKAWPCSSILKTAGSSRTFWVRSRKPRALAGELLPFRDSLRL